MSSKGVPGSLVLVLLGVGTIVVLALLASKPPALPPPNPNHPLQYSGSVPYYDIEKALVSLRENINRLDIITSYVYFLAADGLIARRESVSEKAEAEIVSLAKQAGKEILLGIENDEDPDIVDALLQDSDKRQEHIGNIVMLAQTKGYDGVVVDYENLQSTQAQSFIRYLAELSPALHTVGKKLTISVNVEDKGRVFHGIDVVAIAPLVDRVSLNLYEESNAYTSPGPIASFGWVHARLKNMVKEGVPPEKIMLGTAHSGHDWKTGDTPEFFKDSTAREALELQQQTGAARQWDSERRANFYEYTDSDGMPHVMWIEDAQSFQAKVDLAKRYKVQGMFLWRLGGEDPLVWQTVGR